MRTLTIALALGLLELSCARRTPPEPATDAAVHTTSASEPAPTVVTHVQPPVAPQPPAAEPPAAAPSPEGGAMIVFDAGSSGYGLTIVGGPNGMFVDAGR
jgi:hypothetical protein